MQAKAIQKFDVSVATPAGAAVYRGYAVAFLCLAAYVILFLAQLGVSRAGDPAFDFRYFWVAGKLWAEGVSPYGPVYAEAGARLVTNGSQPQIWPYPPNLWLSVVPLAFFDLVTAWQLWLVASLAAIVAASAVLAASVPERCLPGRRDWPLQTRRLGFFSLHLALVGLTEFAQLSYFVGQISIFIYLGGALLYAGLARGSRFPAIAGLVLLFLKPQVGAIVGLGLLVSGRKGAGLSFQAGLVLVVLILPAMFADPYVLQEWLATITSYDGIAYANLPFAMSGFRHLFWAFSRWDTGNLLAMVVALAAGLLVALALRRRTRAGGSMALADLVAAELLVALAFAPLHLYDFVAFGVGGLVLLSVRGAALMPGLFGLLLCLWPSDLYVALFPDSFVPLFTGTGFATMGAIAVLLAILYPRRAGGAVAK